MTTYTESLIAQINAKIESLQEDVIVETNEGTYSSEEACRKIGVGDPKFADYHIYEALDGSRRIVGCDPKEAPGRPRRIGMSAKHRREQIAALRDLAKSLRSWPSHEPLPAAQLESLGINL